MWAIATMLRQAGDSYSFLPLSMLYLVQHMFHSVRWTYPNQYEQQLANAQARLAVHDAQLDVLHAWVGHLKKEQRLLPELLERWGPQTLTPAHQAQVKAFAARLHELSGFAFQKIYGELNDHFQVGRYSDIPDAQ